MPNRKPYLSDVSDEEWVFVAPYLLALVRTDVPQRTHDLPEVFNALWYIVRAGASWRMLPHDFPPWEAGYQQTHRDVPDRGQKAHREAGGGVGRWLAVSHAPWDELANMASLEGVDDDHLKLLRSRAVAQPFGTYTRPLRLENRARED